LVVKDFIRDLEFRVEETLVLSKAEFSFSERIK